MITNIDIPMMQHIRLRKESDEYYIIVVYDFRTWYLLSHCFVEIVEMCNGENSVEKIIGAYFGLYPEIENEKLKSDVLAVISKSYELGILKNKR